MGTNKDITTGRVVALALHGLEGEAMVEVDSAQATVGGGLDSDRRGIGNRGITLLSSEQWREVCADLDAELPWHTRRANVLVEGLQLSKLIGRTLRLGDIQLQIHDETRPCGLMDKLHPGLLNTLKPECRGGVHGEVLAAGTVRIGDTVAVDPT